MERSEKLKELINNADLFSINPETDKEAFAPERMRFLRHLTEYMSISRRDYNMIYLEIWETADECIGYFDSKRGNFLHYFNHSLKNRLDRDKKISNIDKITDSGNTPLTKRDGEKGDELFDLIECKTVTAPDSETVAKDLVPYLVRQTNRLFQREQERTKVLLSKLLTIRMAEALLDFYTEAGILLREAAFVDSQILTAYMNGEDLPTAKCIAEQEGKSEQHASRSINRFIEKLMENDKFAEVCAYMNIGNA